MILWFTFPQIVAMTAVCALSYGAYRYSPVGPSEVRMALAVMLALFGMAMVVGKVGGRRLPVVAADLLRFGLGPRRYAGPLPTSYAASRPRRRRCPRRSSGRRGGAAGAAGAGRGRPSGRTAGSASGEGAGGVTDAGPAGTGETGQGAGGSG